MTLCVPKVMSSGLLALLKESFKRLDNRIFYSKRIAQCLNRIFHSKIVALRLHTYVLMLLRSSRTLFKSRNLRNVINRTVKLWVVSLHTACTFSSKFTFAWLKYAKFIWTTAPTFFDTLSMVS